MSNSWKQYGGRQHLYNNNNITTTTIVCEELSILGAYQGGLTINGSLTVNNDVFITGNLDISQNLVMQDLQLRGNCIIDGQLEVMGPIVSDSGIQLGNPIQGLLYAVPEMDTVYLDLGPQSSFVVVGESSNLFNVISSNDVVDSIVAQNATNRGIMMHVDLSMSSIQFFDNDGQLNTDFQIAYMHDTGLLEVDGNGSMYIATPLLLGDLSANIVNEQVAIYDRISGSAFCESVFTNDLLLGQALSLLSSSSVSYSSAAVTGFHIMNPSRGLGLHCAGGVFPSDTTRSFGMISTDVSFSYPSLQIVSGSSTVLNKSTTGFNTFSPQTDTYIMDINGPVYVHHNEVTHTRTTDYSILNTTSLNGGQYIAMIGAATQITIGLVSGYVHPVTYSSNGGITWNRVYCDLSIFGSTQFNQSYTAIYALPNTTCLFVGGFGGSFFYSNNSGLTWHFITILTDDFFTNIYASKQGSTITIYASLQTVNPYMVIFTLPYTNIMNGSDTITINPPTKIFDTNLTSITHILGDATNIYVLGAGIQNTTAYLSVRDLSLLPVSAHSFPITGASMTLSSSQLCVVGNNQIYYTSLPVIAFTTYTPALSSRISLSNIYLYDGLRSVLVGYNESTEQSVLYYSDNGLQTIVPVSNTILNSQGNGFQLLSHPLTYVFMPDPTHFIFVGSYNIDILNPVNRVFECFFPDIFDPNNHTVLDIMGRMNVTGDMHTSSIDTAFLHADAMTGTDVSFNSCYVSGSFVAAHLNILNVDISDSFTVGNVFTTGGNLQVGSNAAFGGNVSIGGDLSFNIVTGGQMITNGIINYGVFQQNSDAVFAGHAAFLDTSFNSAVTCQQLHVTGPVYVDTFIKPTSPSQIGYQHIVHITSVSNSQSITNDKVFSNTGSNYISTILSQSLEAGVWSVSCVPTLNMTAGSVPIDCIAATLSTAPNDFTYAVVPVFKQMMQGYVSLSGESFSQSIQYSITCESPVTLYLNVSIYTTGTYSAAYTFDANCVFTRVV